jgi:hypothetical protein
MFAASQAGNLSRNEQDSDDSESSDDSVPSSAGRKKKPETITIEDSSDELSKSNRTTKPTRKTRRTKKPLDTEPAADLSDSDPVITSSAVRKPVKKATIVEDSSEEDIISPRKRGRQDLTESSSDSDSDIRASPVKRRHTSNALTDSVGGADSPRSSPVHATRKRTQKKRHRTQKEKDLELMKLRRAGNKNAVLSESESSSEEDSDDEQTLDHLSEFEDEEEDEVQEAPKVKVPRAVRRERRSEDENDGNENDDEDNFVIEDDDEIGIPGGSDIPLEFTAHYNKPEKEHFRDAVEFFVHKELNPTYAEKQDLYQRAFQKLDSKPETLRNSEYKSSQWTTEFVTALEARPNYVEVPVSGSEFGEGRCEPCNRSKHPPKYAISFTGKAYDKETLEEIEQDEGDDSDEEDSQNQRRAGSVDGSGRHVVAESRE